MAKSKTSKSTKKKGDKQRATVSGDQITISDVSGNAAIAAGRGASASAQTVVSQTLASELESWRSQMDQKIESQVNLSKDDKEDLKQQVEKLATEAVKGEQAEPSRLQKLIDTLFVLSPDIWDVAIATLANPLAGIGLVLKKIGDKARVERQAQSTKPA